MPCKWAHSHNYIAWRAHTMKSDACHYDSFTFSLQVTLLGTLFIYQSCTPIAQNKAEAQKTTARLSESCTTFPSYVPYHLLKHKIPSMGSSRRLHAHVPLRTASAEKCACSKVLLHDLFVSLPSPAFFRQQDFVTGMTSSYCWSLQSDTISCQTMSIFLWANNFHNILGWQSQFLQDRMLFVFSNPVQDCRNKDVVLHAMFHLSNLRELSAS